MREWKEIRTVEDIPPAGNLYSWQRISCDENDIWHDLTNEPVIQLYYRKATGKYRYRYREEQWPTDEYINAHLWEVIHGSEKYVEVWPFIDTPHWVKKGAPHSTTMTREWFLTARHVLKSAIKVGIE